MNLIQRQLMQHIAEQLEEQRERRFKKRIRLILYIIAVLLCGFFATMIIKIISI